MVLGLISVSKCCLLGLHGVYLLVIDTNSLVSSMLTAGKLAKWCTLYCNFSFSRLFGSIWGAYL